MVSMTVPLIIDGLDITSSYSESVILFEPNPVVPHNIGVLAVGATPSLCVHAVQSCAKAFTSWKDSSPPERRRLFNNLANLLRGRRDEIQILIEQEISCSSAWASINIEDSIAIAEQVAAEVTSGVLSGIAPVVKDPEAHAVIIKEPLGIVLGIAPWNAPLILGLRAVAAAVASGNTVILKGSEMSPRTHYLIASLFRDAGFPPGVVNYIQHSAEDAAECFESLISHKAVQKCNFTGSTTVGRHIAQRAAFHLKPVLLELGGKNFAIILEDADIQKAANAVLSGGFLNVQSGQICMSTDIVLVVRSVEREFKNALRKEILDASQHVTNVINNRSQSRIDSLIDDAARKGSKLTSVPEKGRSSATIIEDLSPDMDFWAVESFGPLLGVRVIESQQEAIQLVNEGSYGLSGAIFSRSHLKALSMAKELNTGAVHVNSSTVHDEACLPHGGRKESGWGRFGGHWGFEEFLQTKTVILHP